MSAYILWIPLILLVAWLMIIRPQRNARRRAAELSGSLDVGDEVVTIGGLYGQIVTIDDRSVELDVAEGVTLRFARRAIAGKAPVDEPEDDDVEDDDDLENDEDDLEEDDDLETTQSWVSTTSSRTTSSPARRRRKSRPASPLRATTNRPVVDALD